MTDQLSDAEVVSLAKQFYETDLRESLEAEHRDEFVTIEPVSRTYYLGSTFSEAVQNAKRACPGSLSYTLRVGHRTALHLDTVPHFKKLANDDSPWSETEMSLLAAEAYQCVDIPMSAN